MFMEMLMDSDALDDSGPFRSVQTTDLSASGPVSQGYRHSTFTGTIDRPSPHGGIEYIDQAVGGVGAVRGDVTSGPLRGIRSYRSRTQPFTGDFIGGGQPVEVRTQGRVGLSNRASVGVRARSALSTNLPDDGAVVAAFTNPALAALLSKVRGQR